MVIMILGQDHAIALGEWMRLDDGFSGPQRPYPGERRDSVREHRVGQDCEPIHLDQKRGMSEPGGLGV